MQTFENTSPLLTHLAPWIFLFLVVLCRIGGFIMLAPGVSSLRVPIQVRAFFALAFSGCLFPLLLKDLSWSFLPQSFAPFTFLLFKELCVGILLGLFVRFFLSALQFSALSIVASVGFPSTPEISISEEEPSPPLANFITLAALSLLMVSDLPVFLLEGLFKTYQTFPIGAALDFKKALQDLSRHLQDLFLLTLKLSSPFLIYGIVVNVAVGVMNKLTPQIPVYFIATPFILAGGIALFYLLFPEFLKVFLLDFFAVSFP